MVSEKGSELVFGLIGPSGTNLNKVTEELKSALKSVRYETDQIILSDLIPLDELDSSIEGKNEYKRIIILQQAGDRFRAKNNLDAVAILGISQIRKIRKNKTGDSNERIPRHAYLLKSLKVPEEVERLRKVYGKNFWAISAYTARESRESWLEDRIKPTLTGNDANKEREFAQKIIRIDTYESNVQGGQNVRNTFPLGDVFFDVEASDFQEKIKRFIHLVFNNSFVTPDDEEYGMFHAYASAFRSSSLSRQVGASILSEKGDIISTGLNEVPKFGGGYYRENDENDAREFKNEEDSNHIKRNEMLKDMFNKIKEAGWFKDEIKKADSQKLVEQALESNILQKIDFLNVTEFGREVHAEMSALMEATRKTVSVQDGTLYCTTFPCHVCAKHIIASGLKKVVYIDPYPKSLAKELFKDSISVDGEVKDKTVKFKPFVGISPKRYLELFEMSERKDSKTGKIKKWREDKADPRFEETKPYFDDEINDLRLLANKKNGRQSINF